jgi:hypothetical protein
MTISKGRAPLWVKLNVEECLNGAVRQVLKPSERSVWVDFLCLGAQTGGVVSIFNRATKAKILAVPISLLDRAIDKMLQAGILNKHNPTQTENKCEIFSICGWRASQGKYLQNNTLQGNGTPSNDADSMPREKESRGEENREEKNSSEERRQEDETCNKPDIYNPDIGPCCDSSKSRKGIDNEEDQEIYQSTADLEMVS